MKVRTLVGALAAAGMIGVGAGAAWHDHLAAPFAQALANPVLAAGVATPAASPGATSLPLTGFTELVKTYGPAVVNISVSGTQKTAMQAPNMPEFDEDSPFRDFFKGFRGQVPRGNVPIRGLGSGFIVSADGYILTNAHVVANADDVWVRLTDRRELKAKVIGINSQIYSRSGGYQGISFAIPIEVAMSVKDQIVKHGKVTRGRLGVSVQEVNAPLAESFGLDRPHGALVASVDPSGPAERAGIEVGDVILKYDGKPIERAADLPLLVANTAPGNG